MASFSQNSINKKHIFPGAFNVLPFMSHWPELTHMPTAEPINGEKKWDFNNWLRPFMMYLLSWSHSSPNKCINKEEEELAI